MYKKLLKNIKLAKAEFVDSLYKSDSNAILSRKPHFIFSASNPLYPDKQRLKMSHDDVLDLLQRKGYQVEHASGKYGKEEPSIIVHNPPQHSLKHLFELSSDLGQESSIYSDGYNHEMHYHHGPNAGKHNKGQGTTIHKKPPKDFYTTMGDGTHFSHVFDVENLHEPETSMFKQRPVKINKSEDPYTFNICKNEKKHRLVTAMPNTKLIHYSNKEGLEEIDPRYHGKRGIGSETSRSGKPKYPMSFHYLEGTKPEDIVLTGATHKYVSRLGDHKLYDIGLDPDGIKAQLRHAAQGRQVNPGIYTKQDLDKAIIDAGYHGIYNSSLGDTMKNVVGLYRPIKPDFSFKIHQKDREEASSKDFHGIDSRLEQARRFAEKHGRNPDFLHNLSESFRSEDD